MNEKFIVQGGRKLKGILEVRGAKNAAFPVLAATLLTKEDCVIDNLPLIEDVRRMLEILESMGAKVSWTGERKVTINTAGANPDKINKELVCKLRGSVLFFGPLLARFGKVFLPQPGGCVIGARPIDTHLDAFSQFGAAISPKKNGYLMERKKPWKGGDVLLNEFSVTGTANAMLLAAGLPVLTTIKIADQDYQAHELAYCLNQMSAKITLLESHMIEARGAKILKGFKHTLMFDPIEAGTFAVLGIATKSQLTITNVEYSFLELFFKKLKEFGAQFTIRRAKKSGLPPYRNVVDVTLKPWRKLAMDKVQSWIYPGVHTDLQSVLGVLATQATGSTLLHDPLFEGRLKYLEEINKMGAEIYFADPHRAIINGPTPLFGTDLGPLELRGGAALIIAALLAKGKSTVNNAYQIDRGYEKIEERLQKVGARIVRTS